MNLQPVVNRLQNILNTYLSIRAYFYQNILQTSYKNSSLSTYKVNYTLLLPGSQFNTNLKVGEVGAQMQAYINLCQQFVADINAIPQYQNNLFLEQIQNQLNNSIAQLNGFATNLLNAEYEKLIKYTIPYNMGLTEALYLNNLSLNTYAMQASLNYGIADFNNLSQGTQIVLVI